MSKFEEMPPMSLPKRMLDGYASFRANRYVVEAERYAKLGTGYQKPRMMVIACCDSRAAPETIFDCGPGELFVVRNVANLVPPYAPDGKHHSTSAALEFAVLSLKVEAIVIMGHGRCGGIAATVNPGEPLSSGDFISKWMSDVKDVAAEVVRPEGCSDHDHLMHVERASVEHSLANLSTFPWVRARVNQKELTLHGAWFDIALGELHTYDAGDASWQAVAG
jgi:carbonic anhydrase